MKEEMKKQINRLKKWLIQLLIGALRIIVAPIIVATLLMWLIQIIDSSIDYTTQAIEWLTGIHLGREIMYPSVVVALAMLSFVIGQIDFGKRFAEAFKRRILFKIPFYKDVTRITEDLLDALQQREGKFRKVVIVIFIDRFAIGFVTAESDNLFTVYVPSSPNPMNGFQSSHLHTQTIPTELDVKTAFGYILKFGLGTEPVLEIIENYLREKALNSD
jgi:uncharacterized membrane protein